jgi:hypothetical protein
MDPDDPPVLAPVEIEASPLLLLPEADAMSTSPLLAPELAPERTSTSPPDAVLDDPEARVTPLPEPTAESPA